VFGPNLIRQKNETALEAVENTMLVTQIVDDLIKNYSAIFEVSFLFPYYSIYSFSLLFFDFEFILFPR